MEKCEKEELLILMKQDAKQLLNILNDRTITSQLRIILFEQYLGILTLQLNAGESKHTISKALNAQLIRIKRKIKVLVEKNDSLDDPINERYPLYVSYAMVKKMKDKLKLRVKANI